jgi:hypothetical protein
MGNTILVSSGEYLDRMAVLWVKSARFLGDKRHEAVRRFCELESKLSIGADVEEEVNGVYLKLLTVHQILFDTENEIRDAAGAMPIQVPGSTKGWYDASLTDDLVRNSMLRHSQAAYTISQMNESRHNLIRQIDSICGDQSEPKQYGKPA